MLKKVTRMFAALPLVVAAVLFAPEAAAQWTRLHQATQDSPAKVREMIPGRDVNARDPRGETALHVALAENNRMSPQDREEMVRLLMEAGANSLIRNRWRETPLSRAHRLNYPESIIALLFPSPEHIPFPTDEVKRGYLACQDSGRRLLRKIHDRGEYMVFACEIKTRSAVRQQDFNGCHLWRGYTPGFSVLHAGAPFCKDIFGDEFNFPPPPDRAAYVGECDRIGRAPAHDRKSCVCPADKPHRKGDDCLSDAQVQAIADERRAQGIPVELRDDRVEEYLNCTGAGYETSNRGYGIGEPAVNPRTGESEYRNYTVWEVVCKINFRDMATGKSHQGCWITTHHRAGHGRDHFLRNRARISGEVPDCRDVFGDPAEFPAGRGKLHAVNCGALGRNIASDGVSCECPAERPNPRRDGGDKLVRCLTDEQAAWAESCAEGGGAISEAAVGNPPAGRLEEENKAFFCDFPDGLNAAGGAHESCILYGPANETDRAGLPSCAEADFEALSGAKRAALEARLEAREKGIHDGLALDRIPAFLECNERHEALENIYAVVQGYSDGRPPKRTEYYETACRIKFRDAVTGREWDGCWIQNDENIERPNWTFTRNGITNDNPDCREVFGDPVEFPTGGGDDAVYAVNCEAAGRFTSDDLQSCGCPSERPEEFEHEGRTTCLSADEKFVLDACLERGLDLRDTSPDDALPAFACFVGEARR